MTYPEPYSIYLINGDCTPRAPYSRVEVEELIDRDFEASMGSYNKNHRKGEPDS